MNAETGNESDSPESPKRHRGRIPQAAWPQILQRHRAGATLSAIAREFDCTPSAISYIVRKAEAVGVSPTEFITKPAPELVAAPITNIPAMNTSVINTLSLPNRSTLSPRAAAPDANPVNGGQTHSGPADLPQPAPVAPIRTMAGGAAETPRPSGSEAPVRPSQPPPVDATEARLRETARACLVAYRGWKQGPAEVSVQTLNDAVHDLRKVLARIEIDLSTSRREEQGMRPIPVPAHRAARQR
jgi:hypothetical protein